MLEVPWFIWLIILFFGSGLCFVIGTAYGGSLGEDCVFIDEPTNQLNSDIYIPDGIYMVDHALVTFVDRRIISINNSVWRPVSGVTQFIYEHKGDK